MIEILKHETAADDYESILFVLKAISEDTTRPFLMVLHVEKIRNSTHIIATDGHRLHLAVVDLAIPEGDYMPLIMKGNIILRPRTDIIFPNWQKVLPKTGSELCIIDLSTTSLSKKSGKCGSLTLELVKLYEKTKQVVNLQYLNDLTKATWTVFGSAGTSRAVLLKCEDNGKERSAVIMPLDLAAA